MGSTIHSAKGTSKYFEELRVNEHLNGYNGAGVLKSCTESGEDFCRCLYIVVLLVYLRTIQAAVPRVLF